MRFWKKVSLVALVSVFAVIALEFRFRIQNPGRYSLYQGCRFFSTSLHHWSISNCLSRQRVDGEEVVYSFNQHGFRERKVAEFYHRKNTVAVVGDSVVFGSFLSEENTVGRLLEARNPGNQGSLFLNVATPFFGPTMEGLVFREMVSAEYGVHSVLWFLNPSDINDERFAYAVAEGKDPSGVPTLFSIEAYLNVPTLLYRSLNFLNRGRLLWIDSLSREIVLREQRQLISGIPLNRQVLCGGIFRLADILKERKLPFLIVFTPHPVDGSVDAWAGEPFHQDALDLMLGCARESGAKVIDLTQEKQPPSSYFGDRVHFTKVGTKWLVDRIYPDVEEFLSSNAKAISKAKIKKKN